MSRDPANLDRTWAPLLEHLGDEPPEVAVHPKTPGPPAQVDLSRQQLPHPAHRVPAVAGHTDRDTKEEGQENGERLGSHRGAVDGAQEGGKLRAVLRLLETAKLGNPLDKTSSPLSWGPDARSKPGPGRALGQID
eukprot:15304475-Alexandrium_andersonii.AAC.1